MGKGPSFIGPKPDHSWLVPFILPKGPGPAGSSRGLPYSPARMASCHGTPRLSPLPSPSFFFFFFELLFSWALPPEACRADMHVPWNEWGDGAPLLESRERLQIFICHSRALCAIPNGEDASLCFCSPPASASPGSQTRDSGHNGLSEVQTGLSLLEWSLR